MVNSCPKGRSGEMKIAVAQINTTIGDFDGNSAEIIDDIEWAR